MIKEWDGNIGIAKIYNSKLKVKFVLKFALTVGTQLDSEHQTLVAVGDLNSTLNML